jgi:hypothetical protein
MKKYVCGTLIMLVLLTSCSVNKSEIGTNTLVPEDTKTEYDAETVSQSTVALELLSSATYNACVIEAPLSASDVDALIQEQIAHEHLQIRQDEKAWQAAYSELLICVETYNYVEREYVVPGSYSTPPIFCLYDIDKSGVPELVLISDDGNWDNPSCEVFSYIDGTAKKIGSMNWNLFGSIEAPDFRTEGLYSDDGYKGHYGSLYHYTIQNGILTERLICEYNFQPSNGKKAYVYEYDETGSVHDLTGNVYAGEQEAYAVFSMKLLDFYQITDENTIEAIMLTDRAGY